MPNNTWNIIEKQSSEEHRDLQNKQIAYLMHTLVPMHPFYRRLYESKGIDYRNIRTIEEFQKLPLSSKHDILPTDSEPRKPRDFILQPNEELIKHVYPKGALIKMLAKKAVGINVKEELEYEYKPVHTHFTTGRSSMQIPFLYSRYDLDLMKETGNRLFQVVGATKDDVAVNAFPYAPHLAFWLAFYAITGSGVLGLETGGGKIMGTEKIIAALERMNASILIIIPGYGYHLLREAVSKGKKFPNLKLVVFGGERVSPGLRVKVRELLKELGASDARIVTTYSFTEAKTAWAECQQDSGYHLYPDLEFVEVVDRQGNPVKDGEKGEVVYTNLGWRGSMVIRYRTGDMCEGIDYSPCSHCGRTVPRIKPGIERSSEYKEFQLTKIKGELVNLNAFYSVLHEFPEVAEWQVELKKKNDDPFELDEIHLRLALKGDHITEGLLEKIEMKVVEHVFVKPAIKTHSLPELIKMLGMETELKEKRIVDSRPKT